MTSIAYEPKSKYLDEHNNRSIRMKGGAVTYRGYTIVEKRDFGLHGFQAKGFKTTTGYVVTDGFCNVMPGACWFHTGDDAMRAIDDLIDSQRGFVITGGEHPFWALNRFRNNCEERAPELALLLLQMVQAGAEAASKDPKLAEAWAQAKKTLDRIDFNCDMRTTVHEVDGTIRKAGERKVGAFGGVAP